MTNDPINISPIRATLILFALFLPIAAQPQTITGKVVGNRNSKIYHLPNCPDYGRVAEKNRVPFATEADAVKAGYRKARNCPQ